MRLPSLRVWVKTSATGRRERGTRTDEKFAPANPSGANRGIQTR